MAFRFRRWGVVFIVWLAAGPVLMPGVQAAEHEPIVVRPDATFQRTYRSIQGFNPLIAEAEFPFVGTPHESAVQATPTQCRSAAFCDTIPLRILRPADLAIADEYFVRIDVGAATTGHSVAVWSDPEGTEPVVVGNNYPPPATVTYVNPHDRAYLVVTRSCCGTSDQPYTVRITTRVEKAVRPVDDSDRRPRPPTAGGTGGTAGSPLTLDGGGGGSLPGTGFEPSLGEGFPSTSPVPSFEDDPLFAVSAPSSAAELSEALPAQPIAVRRPQPAPPSPPSPLTLLLWLGALPCALFAAERFALVRAGKGEDEPAFS